jgi:hypothetical protein
MMEPNSYEALANLCQLLLSDGPTCKEALLVLSQLQGVHLELLWLHDHDEGAAEEEPPLKRRRSDRGPPELDSSTVIGFMQACVSSVTQQSSCLADACAQHAIEIVRIWDDVADGAARQQVLEAACQVWSIMPGLSIRDSEDVGGLIASMQPQLNSESASTFEVEVAFGALQLLSHMGLVHSTTSCPAYREEVWSSDKEESQEVQEEQEELQPIWQVHVAFLRACAGLLQLPHTTAQRLQLVQALAAYVRRLRTNCGSSSSFSTALPELMLLLLWGALQQGALQQPCQVSKDVAAALLCALKFEHFPDIWCSRRLHCALDALICAEEGGLVGQQQGRQQVQPLCPHPLEVLAALL